MASFLGGKNTALLEDDVGPWNDYEIVDGAKPDDVVGIKSISKQDEHIFKYTDF